MEVFVRNTPNGTKNIHERNVYSMYNYNIKDDVKLTDILRNSGSICVNKDLIRYMDEGRGTGLMRATVLTEIISKFEMWKEKNELQEDNSFFYTAKEIENDTGVTVDLQKNRVFPYLEKLGLLKREIRRQPDNPMKQVRFIHLNIETCKSLFLEVIPKFKEKLEADKKEEKGYKRRHDAMESITPTGRGYKHQPDGANNTSSNTVLSNTELSNNNPPTPQKEKNTKEQPTPEKQEQGNGENNIMKFIVNNFNKDIQDMLMSVESKYPKYITIDLLKGFKEALNKTNNSNKKGLEVRRPLLETIEFMRNGNKVYTYTGFIINKINNPYSYSKDQQQQEKKETSKSNEVIPEWFEELKKEQKQQQNYETSKNKYDFSKLNKRNLL